MKKIAATVASAIALTGGVSIIPAASASAAPSATCSVMPAGNGTVSVVGSGFPGGGPYEVVNRNGATASSRFAADGSIDHASLPPGDYAVRYDLDATAKRADCSPAATKPGETKPEKPGQSEQEQARAEFRQGQKDGFALGRELCEAAAPKKGIAALDPNYERGFESGKKSAIDQFCN
ncbi:hypothetical protein [Streptomyces sp. PSKA30]|uniref:hypothetical protein n=1 Tax=Streptomyces sp. PSKA30 TaxID=2874597 RepID=UPI001CD12F5F|nr:hypothetical protein [Streptomyces sp. PSKA30]MBZ9641548.1 hypothetical protein [Streptomyces sp. PSKA30]